MKQVELARRLGISKSYLSMILSGQRKPNPALAKRLQHCSGKLVHKKTVNFEAGLSLRGRCPKPLDECATLSGWGRRIRTFAYGSRVRCPTTRRFPSTPNYSTGCACYQ